MKAKVHVANYFAYSIRRPYTPHLGLILHTQVSYSIHKSHTSYTGPILHTQVLYSTHRYHAPYTGPILHTQVPYSIHRPHTLYTGPILHTQVSYSIHRPILHTQVSYSIHTPHTPHRSRTPYNMSHTPYTGPILHTQDPDSPDGWDHNRGTALRVREQLSGGGHTQRYHGAVETLHQRPLGGVVAERLRALWIVPCKQLQRQMNTCSICVLHSLSPTCTD